MSGDGARDVKGGEKVGTQQQGFNSGSPSQVYYSTDSQSYMKYGAAVGLYENGHVVHQHQTGFYANSLQPTQVFTTNDLPSDNQTFQELTPVNPYQHDDHDLDGGNRLSSEIHEQHQSGIDQQSSNLQQMSHQLHQFTELHNAVAPEHVHELHSPSRQLQAIGESQRLQTTGESRQLQPMVGNQQMQTTGETRQFQSIGEARQLQTIGGNQQMQTISEIRPFQTICENQQLQTAGESQQLQMINESQQMRTVGGAQQLETISANQQMQAINGSQQLQIVSDQQQLRTISGNQQIQPTNGSQQLQTIGGPQQLQHQQIHQIPEQHRHFHSVNSGLIEQNQQPVGGNSSQQFQHPNGGSSQSHQQLHSLSGQNSQLHSNNGILQTERNQQLPNFNEQMRLRNQPQSDEQIYVPTGSEQVDLHNQSNGSDKDDLPKGRKRPDKAPSEDGLPRKVRKKRKPEETEAANVIMRLQKAAADEYPMELTNEKDEIINFDEKDLPSLLTRMEKLIPIEDTTTVRSRIKKVDWKLVAFGDYSPFTCREAWNVISKKLRQHRVLLELIDDAKAWVNKPWKDFFRVKPVTNIFPNVHPDLPKKPHTSYLIYYHDRRVAVIKENPGIKMHELSQIIATEFHGLAEVERNKYAAQAAQQRRDYEKRLREFYAGHPEIPRPDRGRDSKQKKHTPFNLYYEERLKSVQPNERTMAFKEGCKSMWKALPEENKIYWIDRALDLQKKQADESEQKSTETNCWKEGRPILLKAEQELKDKLAGKPVRPPISAYGLFSRMLLTGEEMKKIDAKERLRMISVKWRDLPPDEKEQLRAQTADSMREYKRQLDVYIRSLPPEKQQEELKKVGSKRKTKTPEKNAVLQTENAITPKIENVSTENISLQSSENINSTSENMSHAMPENIRIPTSENFRNLPTDFGRPTCENMRTPESENLRTPSSENLRTPSSENLRTLSSENVRHLRFENITPKSEHFRTPTSENIRTPTSENIPKSENIRTPILGDMTTPTTKNIVTSSPVVKEEKIEVPMIKRERVETRHLIEAVIPITWDDMADGERSVYIKYIEKIRHYFDTQHQSALQQMIKKEKCESD